MKNYVKTALLLGGLTGLLMLVGGAIGGRGGLAFGLLMAAVMNLGAYWFSDKLALRMSGAKRVTEAEAPDLHATVRRLAASAGLPMPTVHIIPSDQPNAFATGRNPEHAAVAVTEGILKMLTPEELEGVIAHELGHVANRDILISSVAATIAGAITYLGFIARWGAFMGSDDDDNPLGFIGVLVAAIVAPLAAVIIQLAISRSREYQADRSGAELSRHPEALASALKKMDEFAKQIPLPVNPSAAPLFIVNPLRGGIAGLFSTHPPTAERIRRLLEIRVNI
jgi:heat shock protein HtpX